MSFCVECGAEGPTLEGLCSDDFAKKHSLVRAPERMNVAKCAHCGKLELSSGWTHATVEEAIPRLLDAHVEKDPHVTRVAYTWVSRQEHENIVGLTVKANCRLGEWDLMASFRTRVRIRGGACPTCSKQRADYFVGTVQVRADGRPLTDEEGQRAASVAGRAASGGEDFVSGIEHVRGGIDVKVGSNRFAKRLARDLAREFGGTVGSSATLHTQREGREMYRSTYVVRIPAFREGDVVLWRGARYRVQGLGDPVRLQHVDSGAVERVRVRDLATAKSAGPRPKRQGPSGP